jgi:hypothetical protein
VDDDTPTRDEIRDLPIDELIDRAFAADLLTNAELRERDCRTADQIRARVLANLDRR